MSCQVLYMLLALTGLAPPRLEDGRNIGQSQPGKLGGAPDLPAVVWDERETKGPLSHKQSSVQSVTHTRPLRVGNAQQHEAHADGLVSGYRNSNKIALTYCSDALETVSADMLAGFIPP